MIITIIVFVFTLGVLVLVHEFGHFITAKKMGVAVEEFGIGFPPRLWSVKKKETLYSINALPLGGFVKLKGESVTEENQGQARQSDSFAAKKIWQRAVIIVAGVAMNLFLAVVLLGFGFLIGLPSAIDNLDHSAKVRDTKMQIVQVEAGSAADQAGLQAGDAITHLNGEPYQSLDNFLQKKGQLAGQNITLTVNSAGESKDNSLALGSDAFLGVTLVEVGIVSYPWYLVLFKGIEATFFIVVQIFQALWQMITSLVVEQKVVGEVAGPVGIAVLANQVAKLGLPYIVQFIALLSINLAVFNLLPWPALDGGRLFFLLIEKIKGRPVNHKLETIIHNTGFILLILLVLLVTFKDIFSIKDIIGS